MNSTVDLSPLNFLLKATTKQAVEKCLSLVFASRNESSSLCIENLQVILGGEENITIEEATSLYDALLECITVSLYAGEVDALAALYEEKGSEVNPKLKSLVGQIVTAKLALWREASSLSRVSLPKLVDVDWAMHVKTASSEVTRMNVPAVLVELHIEDQPTDTHAPPIVQKVGFELSKEALETMLDGLGKIRDQLSLMG